MQAERDEPAPFQRGFFVDNAGQAAPCPRFRRHLVADRWQYVTCPPLPDGRSNART